MLTRRQKQILDYITKYLKQNDYAPSLEEVRRHFRLSSNSTIHQHIETLREKGYLKKIENQPRSIELNKKVKSSNLVSIPLLGTIAAGEPIEAIEDKETIELPKSQLSKSGKHFALRVRGNSMIEDGIFDGDTVIIKKQPDAENGETVVALINDNEVTLKKIYKEKVGFRLQPANSNLKPIYTKDLIIQGKVISVIRNFKELQNVIQNTKEFAEATIKYMKETDMSYRKALGQYFTPKSIREKLLDKLPNSIKNPRVLDPACGTGEFLITAKKYFHNPELEGWDVDKKIVNIAKELVPIASIKTTDTLLNKEYNKYDFIIGNPPYYEFSPSEALRREFDNVINGRVNIFSLFIYQGINLLKEGGHLAFVVPPSMNNGAYFSKLRKFIVENSNIEYLQIIKDPKLFHGAQQSIMLLVLKKGENKGDYLFEKNGILIFSENTKYLRNAFAGKVTLHDLNFEVKTGKLVWNENRNLLTHNQKGAITLIWAHNITTEGLKIPIIRKDKPQYVRTNNFNVGPAIVTNRVTGTVKSAKLKAAIVPRGMKFIAENHVNVIFPPTKKIQMKINFSHKLLNQTLNIWNLAKQLSSKEKLEVVKNITGNTQISKTELEKLFPISISV